MQVVQPMAGPGLTHESNSDVCCPTSYFLTSAKRSLRKNVAQPSMATPVPVYSSAVFFLYMGE